MSGEGSRGGRVIGHTASGKPIYAEQHTKYETAQEHRDARDAHQQEANKYAVYATSASRGYNQAAKDRQASDHHQAVADFHREQVKAKTMGKAEKSMKSERGYEPHARLEDHRALEARTIQRIQKSRDASVVIPAGPVSKREAAAELHKAETLVRMSGGGMTVTLGGGDDNAASELAKSGADHQVQIGRHAPPGSEFVKSQLCKCGEMYSKSLTKCPHCGSEELKKSAVQVAPRAPSGPQGFTGLVPAKGEVTVRFPR